MDDTDPSHYKFWGKGVGKVQVLFRLLSMVILVVLLTIHIRSLRIFKWEQSVSGGVLVTYSIAVLGMIFGGAAPSKAPKVFQIYTCTTGMVVFIVNAVMIYSRWKKAGELTRVVAELLGALGVPLRRHVLIKTSLSLVISVALLVDLIIEIVFSTA